MRRTMIVALALALACARGEQPAPDAEDMAAEPAAPEPTTMELFVGEWDGTISEPASANALATFDLTASDDPAAWSITVTSIQDPSRTTTYTPRIIAAAGDSVVFESGSQPSVLRRGQRMTSTTTMRVREQMLSGTIRVRYANGDTLTLRSFGIPK